MAISLLAIGLISILAQVVLLRELNVSFFGVELIYLLGLGIWLFWTGRRRSRRTPESSSIAYQYCGTFYHLWNLHSSGYCVYPLQPSDLWRRTRRVSYLFSAINCCSYFHLSCGVAVRPLIPVDGKGIRDNRQDAGRRLCC